MCKHIFIQYIVACHLPRAPSYDGVRTWAEGSQMCERGGTSKGGQGEGAWDPCIGFSVQYVYNVFTSLTENRLEWE